MNPLIAVGLAHFVAIKSIHDIDTRQARKELP